MLLLVVLGHKMSTNSSVSGAESPIQASSNASSDVASSESPTTVLVVGGGVAGLAVGLALSAIGCEVHIYQQSRSTCPSSSETGVPLTEELLAFLAAHGVEVVRGTCALDRMLRPH